MINIAIVGCGDWALKIINEINNNNKFNLTSTLRYAWRTRRVWWFSSLARTKARFARTTIGGFWLGLSNLLSIAALASIYGVVLKVDNFNSYIIYPTLASQREIYSDIEKCNLNRNIKIQNFFLGDNVMPLICL